MVNFVMKCPVCKKNISDSVLKCPYCNTRVGLLCNHCNTINPIGNLVCKECGQELLKICPHCGSVNFPNATKCRKCSSPLKKVEKVANKDESFEIPTNPLKFSPKFYTRKQALDILTDEICSKEKKVFSISGGKGLGKTTLLRQVMVALQAEKLNWGIGKCTPLTQLTPGGVIQDMLLDLFKLPNFCENSEDFYKDATKFFRKEFQFLSENEVVEFINFLYNFKDGNYEDIIINKRKTYEILMQVFEAFINTNKFVFVIDNFDFIDGFSIEFLTYLMHKESIWKSIKLIFIYNNYRPVNSIFGLEDKDLDSFEDISLASLSNSELEKSVKLTNETGTYVTQREKEVIFNKCAGNPAFAEQAISYSFDCQISDKAFLIPNNFNELIKERLLTLKKFNLNAYKLLCGASILGDRLNLSLLKDIFAYKHQEFNEIMSYLVKSNFVRPYNEMYYEFNNLLLWETILKNIPKNSFFEELNVKLGKAISVYNLNTSPTLAMIAHNLKDNRLAFDFWTKITRLASYIGDINLYVISQKQCLALLNEFNENETLNIRYNISERLGKLLSEYDAEEALDYLPDAISNARENNDEAKEIDLLGYLALCCKKVRNYFGDVECVDNVLKKMKPSQEIEIAMIKATKLQSLLKIGNCGEVINLIDNDILPVLSSFLEKPKLNKSIPLGFIYDTWLRTYLILASALSLQGNNRAFDILNLLFNVIEKHKIEDSLLICKAKLVLAYANTMKGDFKTSNNILEEVNHYYREAVMDDESISQSNLIQIINMFMQKEYEGLQELLFYAVTFANNVGDNFTKHISKALLGKIFKDNKQAKHAIEIYDEQITYFAKEKMALGALLSWYLIVEATIVTENPKNAIDIASRALDIAKNPNINNTFFIVNLKMIIAKAYMELSDYETVKINLESALILAKKYEMFDVLARIYFLYGIYYKELGTIQSQNQSEYLKGAFKMYDKAMSIVCEKTKNTYIRDLIDEQKKLLISYCEIQGFNIC